MIIKAMLELIKYLADKGNLLCIGYAVPDWTNPRF